MGLMAESLFGVSFPIKRNRRQTQRSKPAQAASTPPRGYRPDARLASPRLSGGFRAAPQSSPLPPLPHWNEWRRRVAARRCVRTQLYSRRLSVACFYCCRYVVAKLG